MAEESTPQGEHNGERDFWNSLRSHFFIILNVIISGSSGRPRPEQEAASQRKPVRQTDYYRWSVFLGLLLLILNMVINFQFLLSDILGWAVPFQDNFGLQLLLYFLLGLLCSFLVGVLRGCVTGQSGSALRLGWRAELIGMIPVILLSVLSGILLFFPVIYDFFVAITGHPLDDLAPVEFIADGLEVVPLLGCIQLLISVGGVKLGGFIGSRFLRRRPRPA